MSTDLELKILLSAVDQTGGIIAKLTSGLGPIGGLALGVGAAITGIGVTASKMAGDFQEAMDQNIAHAGLAANQVQRVSDALFQMAPAVGQGPTQLANAMYPILSGFSGISNQSAKTQVSLVELNDAAKSVAGSTTSTSTAALAMTQTFNALGLQSNDTSLDIRRMNALSDVMNQTITEGNMKWQDYANVAGKLATAIKGTGVNFNEASAALATMTNEGFSAQRSQTYLANLFTQLDLKTDSLAKNAKKLGIAFDEQKFKAMPLGQQLNYLQQITGGNSSEVLKLLNNNSTALKTYNALESGINNYNGTLNDLRHATDGAGATNKDFAKTQDGFNQKMKDAHAALDVVFIKIGQDLLPVLEKMLNVYVIPLIQKFGDWVTHSGFVKTATNELMIILQDAATVLGDVFGWFDKNQWALYAIRDAAIAFGVGLASIKVLEFTTGIGNMFAKLKEGDGVVSNLADKFLSKFLPNVKTAFFDKGGLSDATDTAKRGLQDVATQADVTAGEEGIGKIGPAVTEAETTVEAKTGASGMAGAFASVAGPLGIGAILVALPAIVQGVHDSTVSMLSDLTSQVTTTYNNIHTKAADPLQFLIDVKTQFDHQAAVQAENDWQQWFNQMTSMGYNPNVSSAPVTVAPGTHGGHVAHHDVGGYIPPNAHILGDTPYPEIVMRAGSGGLNVYNPTQTAAMLGGGRGGNISVVVNVATGSGDPNAIGSTVGAVVRRELADAMRSYSALPNMTSGGRL